MVHKWNKKVKEKCVFCNIDHTSKHLLYDCIKSKEIWNSVETIIGYKIIWKHIVIGQGFINSKSSKLKAKALLVAITAKAIFSYWAKYSKDDQQFRNSNMRAYICSTILLYKDIFRTLGSQTYFEEISGKIIERFTI